MHPLRATRIAFSATVLVVVMAVFLDIRHWLPTGLIDAMVSLQFGPAVLGLLTGAGSAAFVLAALVLLTLLFGRVYCSFLCPLGAVQDLVLWFRRRNYKHRRFPYTLPMFGWHYAVTALVIASAAAGSLLLLNNLEPFSTTGRMMTHIVRPALMLINNATSLLSRSLGGMGIAEVPFAWPGWWTLMGAAAFMIFILVLSFRSGRLFCNLLCPVGGVLSLLSHKPAFAVRIADHDCIDCGLCERVCRAQCIDSIKRTIDTAACVGCFDCLESCPTHVIEYQWGERKAVPPADGRRQAVTALTAVAVAGLVPDAVKEERQALYDKAKTLPVVPPGGLEKSRFSQLCTGCQLCVSACPTQVIQPALGHYGWEGIFQPRMDYAVNYCTFDCVRCGEVCPTGALKPLTLGRKHITQIGKAIFVKEDCIVETKKKDCGACAEHCPTKAVKMVPYEGKLQIPEVTNEYCVGCGACEHACPTEPRRAIYVKAHTQHEYARPRLEERTAPREVVPEEFPF